MKHTGQIFQTNGIVKAVYPKNGRRFSLKEMQKAVGGYIEPIPGVNLESYVNEESRVFALPFNDVASRYFNQELFGNVLLINRAK